MGILDELQRTKPDVVHLFWGHYPSLVGYLVRTTLPGTVLSLFLGAYDLTRRFGGTPWVARSADLVSTHAECNMAAIEKMGVARERIHLAYRGIDLATFNGTAPKIARRIATVGRLETGKGMDDVLRAFREIHMRWPDTTLRVLGQGPDRPSLERLTHELGIHDRVAFLGHVPQHEVAAQLRMAEVFLLMSWGEWERLPNVVKEAMACRCLCVVTGTAGMDELVENGRHGFLLRPRNVQEAVSKLDDIFSGRVETAGMLQAASERITNIFDASKSMRSYVRRWRHALVRRNTRRSASMESERALADVPVHQRRFSE